MVEGELTVVVEVSLSRATPQRLHFEPRVDEGTLAIPQTRQIQLREVAVGVSSIGAAEEDDAELTPVVVVDAVLVGPEEGTEPLEAVFSGASSRVILGLDLRNPAQYSVWRTSERSRATE